MLLQLCGLTVALQNETILSDLSLSVQKGEFLALLGPSGCGKSTLLKSIAGIVPLQQGQVILDGQDITRTPVHKRGTVILFQEMRLFPNMTVLENVAFPLKMQGIGTSRRKLSCSRCRWATTAGGGSMSSPAGSSSGSRWPALWRRSRGCCCWTNPSLPWTKTCAARCARWLPSCTAALG